jgi:leucyl aminopeptidase
LATEFYSSLYSDNRYRTGDKIVLKAEGLESVCLLVDKSIDINAANQGIESGMKMAAGISLSKDIVNAPHNVLNSESLAHTAKVIAEESEGTLSCKILGKEECEARGMGAYLGVARGSETAPQFIHLTYTPRNGKVR